MAHVGEVLAELDVQIPESTQLMMRMTNQRIENWKTDVRPNYAAQYCVGVRIGSRVRYAWFDEKPWADLFVEFFGGDLYERCAMGQYCHAVK